MALESLRRYRDLELAEGELDAVEALACVELAESRAAAALRLLLATARERRRLSAPIFVADERDDRDATLAAAQAALDRAAIASIRAEVDALDLAALVNNLL